MKRMRKPAAAGPITRVRFMLELFTDTAFISRDSGTMSEMIAWRLGMLSAIIDPLTKPIAITCQKTMTPVTSSVAIRNVITAFPL